MSIIYPISRLPSGPTERLSCRGTFAQATKCLHQVNEMLAASKQPYEFKIISESDPFRIAMFEYESYTDRRDVVDGENWREFAALDESQAAHIRGAFLGMGFTARTLALWENPEFSDNHSCRDVFLRENSPNSTHIFIHGLTCELIDEKKRELQRMCRSMPRNTLR